MSKIKLIITTINEKCDSLEFSEARRIIELNITELQNPTYYSMLNANASVLVKHILNQINLNLSPLSRLEQHQINEINKHCTNFDISMLKRTIKNCLHLLQRPDIDIYLNESAKTILASMGAFIQRETKAHH
ncbi:MAG: hypothetical protein KBT36_03625 [Kurthia sp.]|nr:hypothetical protein [Candidatus Kurthia equi]